jgi:hypothetical protein
MLGWLVLLTVTVMVVTALLVIVWVAKRYSVPERAVSRMFWCPFVRQPVTTEFREDAGTGRRIDVSRCSAFDPSSAIACARSCLELASLPEWAPDQAVR